MAERAIVYTTDDAMLIGNNGDGNYGDSAQMYLRHQNATWGNNVSLATFDLLEIPEEAVVTSAQMRFYTGLASWPETPAPFVPVAVYKNTSAWEESSVTFNTAPAHAAAAVMTVDAFMNGTSFLSAIGSGSQEWLQFSGDAMVRLVQAWVNGSAPNHGVTIAATGDYLPDGRIFSLKTRNHSSEVVRPYLVVDYTLAAPVASSGLVFSIRSGEGGAPIPQVQAFLDKAASEEPITIAYLGGSITRGASVWPPSGTDAQGDAYDYSAYDAEADSWRALSYEWLRRTYEQTPGQFRQVNAAIGGTPSLLGAYRLEQDVLSENPDVVFVEFAVNDSYAGAKTEEDPSCSGSILRTCRSIVDRLRAQNPDVLIFMPLSTHRVLEGSSSSSWAEALDRSHDQMRLAAEMLQVPYVSIKDSFEATRPEGQDPYFGGTDTPGNYVHPAPAGHAAYAETVQASLAVLLQSGRFFFSEDVNPVNPYPVGPMLLLPEALVSGAPGWSVAIPVSVEAPILDGHACLVSDGESGALETIFNGTAVGLWMDTTSKGCMDVYLDGSLLGRYANGVTDPKQFSGRFASLAEDLAPSSHTLRLEPVATGDGTEPALLLRAVIIDQGAE